MVILPTNESIVSTIYQQMIFNKTNMKQINGFQILFVLTFLGFDKGSSGEGVVLPVMMFDEGETAHIPCIKGANDNDFFWRRGAWYENSTNIAYIARGIPSKSNKYDVFMDGTLVIRRTSLTDEGNYFCRILSDTTESYIGITINVRASPEKVEISIEGCTSGSNCLKVLEPLSESQLVCTAEMISESMALKWYNGTKEIMGDLDVPETGRNGKISTVITFTFEEDSILTCKAEGANIEETTAVIQLRKKEESVPIENEDTSIMLIFTIVLGITCVILLGLLISLMYCYRNLKKGQRKSEDNIEMDTSPLEDRNLEQETEEVQNMEPKETPATDSPLSKPQENKEQGEREERKSLLSNASFEKVTPVASISDVKENDKKLMIHKDLVIRQKKEELEKKQQELQQNTEMLSKLQQEKQKIEMDSKLKTQELQNLRAKIEELKRGTVEYLTKTSIRVALVLRPETYRSEKSRLLALSSNYTTVCAVLSQSPSEDLTVMTEDIVESTFDGADSCIVIFGNRGSGLVSTLHGNADVKGLIKGICNQIVSNLEKKKAKGFKVILETRNKEEDHSVHVNNAKGHVVPNMQDRLGYEVKTEEEVTKLTSRMAPTEIHLNGQGYIRFIIIPLSTGEKIARNLTVVSLIGVKYIPRYWTATKPMNAFEKLLFPVLRDKDTIRFLIGHCHPDEENGVDEICKATKQVLDTIIASKKAIAQES